MQDHVDRHEIPTRTVGTLTVGANRDSCGRNESPDIISSKPGKDVIHLRKQESLPINRNRVRMSLSFACISALGIMIAGF